MPALATDVKASRAATEMIIAPQSPNTALAAEAAGVSNHPPTGSSGNTPTMTDVPKA